ncbi:hypothetical protein GUJ93_ZPchr0012g21919 [Zizania palustris]|uniref:Uncharacterized protein n=1 Tax=Zizania palustris TaxID=103762 RepID=A0A8J5WK54_ZIZPA|nr:hypothetical protein GUJ93_ZPchr0012g21919 [Zizania palustris]
MRKRWVLFTLVPISNPVYPYTNDQSPVLRATSVDLGDHIVVLSPAMGIASCSLENGLLNQEGHHSPYNNSEVTVRIV